MRKDLDEASLIAVACGIIAVTVAGLAVVSVMVLKDLSPSVLVRMSGSEPMAELAREIDPDFEFVSSDGHYDGVYFYAIALDPFATKTAHELIDLAPARYSHAGYGWTAWLFGLGRPEWFPASLMVVGLLSIGGAAAVASIIAKQLGVTPWGGLFVALNPGLVYSVTADTSEPLGALLLGFLYLAWRRKKWVIVTLLSIALALTKEIFLIVLGGFFVWRCIKALRDKPRDLRRLMAPLAALSAGPVAWVLWHLYLYTRFDELATSGTPKLIYWPFQGWIEALSIAAGLNLSTADSTQVGQASVPILAISAALLAMGIYRSRRLRNVFEVTFLFVAAFTFCYGPYQLVYPKDWFRLGSTAIILLPAVLLGRGDGYDDIEPDYPGPTPERVPEGNP